MLFFFVGIFVDKFFGRGRIRREGLNVCLMLIWRNKFRVNGKLVVWIMVFISEKRIMRSNICRLFNLYFVIIKGVNVKRIKILIFFCEI